MIQIIFLFHGSSSAFFVADRFRKIASGSFACLVRTDVIGEILVIGSKYGNDRFDNEPYGVSEVNFIVRELFDYRRLDRTSSRR